MRYTIRRWQQLQQQFGHYRALQQNGNTTVTVLRRHNLILLALYRLALPKALHAEVNAFLYRANYGNPNNRFYAHSQICRAEGVLRITIKRGSTTAYQAYLPINVMKRWHFWNMLYPHGIADICRDDMIDLDEAGVFVDTANRSRGKAYIGTRG